MTHASDRSSSSSSSGAPSPPGYVAKSRPLSKPRPARSHASSSTCPSTERGQPLEDFLDLETLAQVRNAETRTHVRALRASEARFEGLEGEAEGLRALLQLQERRRLEDVARAARLGCEKEDLRLRAEAAEASARRSVEEALRAREAAEKARNVLDHLRTTGPVAVLAEHSTESVEWAVTDIVLRTRSMGRGDPFCSPPLHIRGGELQMLVYPKGTHKARKGCGTVVVYCHPPTALRFFEAHFPHILDFCDGSVLRCGVEIIYEKRSADYLLE